MHNCTLHTAPNSDCTHLSISAKSAKVFQPKIRCLQLKFHSFFVLNLVTLLLYFSSSDGRPHQVPGEELCEPASDLPGVRVHGVGLQTPDPGRRALDNSEPRAGTRGQPNLCWEKKKPWGKGVNFYCIKSTRLCDYFQPELGGCVIIFRLNLEFAWLFSASTERLCDYCQPQLRGCVIIVSLNWEVSWLLSASTGRFRDYWLTHKAERRVPYVRSSSTKTPIAQVSVVRICFLQRRWLLLGQGHNRV